MINVATITKALLDIFKEDARTKDFAAIERGVIPNRDMGHTPWLGIYRSGKSYDPHTIGGRWKAQVEIKLLLQAAAFKEGDDVEDLLEEQIKIVEDILIANKKVNDTVDQLVGLAVEYFFNDDDDESFTYQQAEIVVTYEARTQ